MTKTIKDVCVYASSSLKLAPEFYADASELGELLAKHGYSVVYGGSRLGMMYACAGAVKSNGGKVIGIMPERIVGFGCANPQDCDEFIVTKGMRERKAELDNKSQAVIALAGGFGTLEELSEMIVQKQLGYNTKPIVLINTLGFYNNLIKFFDDIIKLKFANEETKNLYYIANSPKDAINYLNNYVEQELVSKFIIK